MSRIPSALVRRGGGLLLLLAVIVGASSRAPESPPQPTPRPTHVMVDGSAESQAPVAADPKTITVGTIAALLDALDDDTIDVIVVRDGTYHVSPSNDEAADSLWIGSRYADRTRPILVRAQTQGGVIFDGGGAGGFGGLSFEDGAHHQTWDGFTFANMTARQTGIIEVGGYVPRKAPHHITLRHIAVERTCTGRATTPFGQTWDHAIYIAHAKGIGPHDLTFEDIAVDGRGGLASAIHFDHGDADNPAASDVTVRRLSVVGTQQAVILWEPALHDVVFDTVDVVGASAFAVRYESIGSTGITFANITSRDSGCQGFYSEQGSAPSGVTFLNVDFDGPTDPKPPGCPGAAP